MPLVIATLLHSTAGRYLFFCQGTCQQTHGSLQGYTISQSGAGRFAAAGLHHGSAARTAAACCFLLAAGRQLEAAVGGGGRLLAVYFAGQILQSRLSET